MNETTKYLLEVSKPLVEQFEAFCESYSLIGFVNADHICIRCSTNEIYEKRRRDLEKDSHFIYQSIISNRRISIVGLREIIPTKVGDIKYLELCDQKPDNSQIDCIDHVEIVPEGISYEELVSKIKDEGVKMKETVRPHHTTYDIILPSGFCIKLSHEFLVSKIKNEEMV